MIVIIDCGSNKVPLISDMLTTLKSKSIVIHMDHLKDIHLANCNGVIISGAPILLTEKADDYLSKFDFLTSFIKPVLGICFGHQILGLQYGARIDIGTNIETFEKISLLDHANIFSGFGEICDFQEDHREFISLPNDFTLTARSESCTVEAMRHSHLPLYGVQFHPEVSGNAGKALFNNFCKTCSGSH